jgi:transcriptional regulator with XRE-family HTH domain
MALQELRRARELSQAQLVEVLGEKQPNISQLEQRTDMYVSTLRKYIEAMGGELDIIARFPEGAVRIRQFQELGGAKWRTWRVGS